MRGLCARCHVRVLLFVMIWFWLLGLLGAPAWAESLRWDFALAPGDVARVEICQEDGTQILRFLTSDGTNRSQFGSRPDENPVPGQVTGGLSSLWLAPGTYRIREVLPDGVVERMFVPTEPPPRVLMTPIPAKDRQH